MSINMKDLQEQLNAHQIALGAIVHALTGLVKEDGLVARSLTAALRDAANELPDGVAKDTIQQLRDPHNRHTQR